MKKPAHRLKEGLTDGIGNVLGALVTLVLRARRLTILAGLVSGVLCWYYAATNLGINTDTADMISPELPWRQDFIDFRDSFTVRNRNIIVVVDAAIPERADTLAGALAERLRAEPERYNSVFLAGDGEFFDRNGLLYLSLGELEDLSDRLAEAQPLLGRIKQQFDGVQLLSMVGEIAERGAGAQLGSLYDQLTEALTEARAGRALTVSWQRLLQTEPSSTARRYIVLQPVLDFTRIQPAASSMEGIRSHIEALGLDGPPERVRITGTVAMEHEELVSVTRGAGLAGLAALLLVAGVLYISLRSVSLLSVSVLSLVVGLGGTAAFATVAVGHLNLLSVAFAVLYIGLGVDFILHVCLRLKELISEGASVDSALVATMRGVGASLVICAVTTAAGFYSFIPTPFSGVSELGLIAGTGMFVSLLVSVTFLPALLAQFYDGSARQRPARWLGARLLRPLSERPRLVIAGAVVAAIATIVALPWVSFDTNPINLRDPGTESVTTLEEIAQDGAAIPMNMAAVAGDRDTAAAWVNQLETLESVESVQSMDSLVPTDQEDKLFVLEDIGLILGPGFAELNRVEPNLDDFRLALAGLARSLGGLEAPARGAAELSRAIDAYLQVIESPRALPPAELEWNLLSTLPSQLERLASGLRAESFGRDALPAELTERWIAADGRELIEIVPAGDMSDELAAERFVDSVRSLIPAATGLPVVHQEAGRTVVGAFQLAFIYALLMVSVILWVFMRNVRDSVLVIVPVVLAAGVTAAIAVVTGLEFNFANIIALPLLLGVGVDNGIHMVHRMRTEPATEGHIIETSTSRAVLASGITTIASFGNLAFAAHLGMASMGKLLTLGMGVTLVATLILLPALLEVLSE